jgi:hypothetical protein
VTSWKELHYRGLSGFMEGAEIQVGRGTSWNELEYRGLSDYMENTKMHESQVT